jgi:hypothetical protein
MADILIQHLKQKGREHSDLAMLDSQWAFDEQLIPKALQTIGSLFPHYSRHDESHSKQILVNVERLLGDNIILLTGTDTWLLLEAAYWHDIGMVVPQDDIEDALLQPAFQQYLENICNEPNHELYKFAINFNPRDLSRCFIGADTPMDAVDKFRQLMAEWFRQQHAGRSERIIQAPWNSVGVSSPRTELIPDRLFRMLGRICVMHGMPFSKLLSVDGLPFKEGGMAQEDCHPRFVACLLRMGDLLDLDNNRFCPVMTRIAGGKRSQVSKAHEDKHAAIRHLRIDRERIEISAECETIDGYLQTFKWFDWLRQEMQDQMANWQDIVPNRALGLLPTLGNIVVQLSGEVQILKEGQRPQFNIDSARAIELLQGDNIYTKTFPFVRELLQNSIDATLLRLWLTEAKRIQAVKPASPFSPDIIKILEDAPVTVYITELTCKEAVDTDKSNWALTITDCGTGISRNDIAYMLYIGGSQSNTQRQNKIRNMPEWMKPSGAFGIGIQSVFLISEKITIESKSIFTNETIEVTMYNPTGNMEGLVLLRLLENDISRPFGTTIKINLEFDSFAKSWSMPISLEHPSIAAQFANSMDPVLDLTFPYEAGELADQIGVFAENSILPIKATLTTKDGSNIEIQKRNSLIDQIPGNWCFIKTDEGQEVAISYKPVESNHHPQHDLSLYYRGQQFENKNIYFLHVRLAINLMSGKAGEWLTASRDNLAPHAMKSLKATILATLECLVRKDLENPNDCELLAAEKKPIYSLFLEAMSLRYGGVWIEFANQLSASWLDLPCSHDKTYRSFFSRSDWILGEEGSQHEPQVDGCDLLVPLYSWSNSILALILNEWLKSSGNTVQVLEPSPRDSSPLGEAGLSTGSFSNMAEQSSVFQGQRPRYRLCKVAQPFYSDLALAMQLAEKSQGLLGNNRYTLYVDSERWRTLFLSKETKVRASPLFIVAPRNSHIILLPFLFRSFLNKKSVACTDEQLRRLCEWIKPHLEVIASFDEVKKAYEDLVHYIDHEVMELSPDRSYWSRLRGGF